MKKDTRTFLATILGIPFALSLGWGIHAMDTTVITADVPETPRPVTNPAPVVVEEEVVAKPAPTPVVTKKPTVVNTPVVVPTPKPAPTVVATPTPTPAPVVTRPSRRTRSS